MMKNTKKLAALFLALVMSFSIMAMTASAYGEDAHVHTDECCEETIQPRKPGAPLCPYCSEVMGQVGKGNDDGNLYFDFQCRNGACTYRETIRVYY